MVGMHGSEKANNSIQLSDCIICVGARFDDRTVGNIEKYAPNAKHIIHINNDQTTFNKVLNNTINVYCPEWNHTYKFYNNHDISVKFLEFKGLTSSDIYFNTLISL